jgi:Cof subfamily protein (haloacid dehalogenase superfamily)
MYDLAFCDLDGTICTYDHQIRSAVRQVVQVVIDSGKWITIATGRGYQTVKPFLAYVPVNAPLILCNGGLVLDPATLQVLDSCPMPLSLVHQIMHLAHEAGLELWVYLDDLQTMLEHRPGDRGFVVRLPTGPVRPVPDPFSLVSRPPHKVVFIAPAPQASPGIAAHLSARLAGVARVIVSSPTVVEVIMPGVSKAGAMAQVASRLGVSREHTLAIGDGDNDLEMIQWAGLGIAMGNASPSLLQVADWVAPSVEQDGLAVALQRFMIDA